MAMDAEITKCCCAAAAQFFTEVPEQTMRTRCIQSKKSCSAAGSGNAVDSQLLRYPRETAVWLDCLCGGSAKQEGQMGAAEPGQWRTLRFSAEAKDEPESSLFRRRGQTFTWGWSSTLLIWELAVTV